MRSGTISVSPGLLPAIKITDPYSPIARAKASAKPVSIAGANEIVKDLTIAEGALGRLKAGEANQHDIEIAMRAAKTYEEKMDLWAAKYAELEKRAADKGVRLVEMGPMMMQHSGTARDNGNGQKSERRMGMMRPEGGGGWSGMRPHPPMGR